MYVALGPLSLLEFLRTLHEKQLLLDQARSDIAQKHRVSRLTVTTGRLGQWNLG